MSTEPEKSTPDDVDSRYIVPGLLRGLRVLELFRADRPELTQKEIEQGADLSVSAAYRVVYTLESGGYVQKDPATKKYRLGAQVLSIGVEYLNALELSVVAQPFIERLAKETNAAAHIVTLEGVESLHVARAVPNAAIISNLPVGRRLPAHATVSGQAILSYRTQTELEAIYAQIVETTFPDGVEKPASLDAFLEKTRRDHDAGYVAHPSLFEPEVFAVACPILDNNSRAIAAISVVAPQRIFDRQGGPLTAVQKIQNAAREIAGGLGFSHSKEHFLQKG